MSYLAMTKLVPSPLGANTAMIVQKNDATYLLNSPISKLYEYSVIGNVLLL